jgi:serine/threonine-protein kinase RsbW
MNSQMKFEVSKDAGRLSIIFSSTMENIDRADLETRLFLEDELTDSQIFGVCLSMREGLTNAVKHGNHNDAGKMIKYVLTITEDRLILEIEDHGQGFDWRKASGKEPVSVSDHGRGLAIIDEYSSEFSFNEKGNQLKITILKS